MCRAAGSKARPKIGSTKAKLMLSAGGVNHRLTATAVAAMAACSGQPRLS
jgi:hypothetical protein